MRSKVIRKTPEKVNHRAHRTISGAVESLEARRLLAVTLAGWEASALTGTTASPFVAQTSDIGLAAKPGLIRDTGLTAAALTKGFSSSNFTLNGGPVNGAATTTDLYFDLTVASNFTVSLSEFDLNYRSTGTGPANAELDYSLDAGATFTPISTAIASGGFTHNSTAQSILPLDLSGVAPLQNLAAGTTVRLRLVPYGGTGAAGTFAIYDNPTAGNDLAIQGTSVGAPGTPTIASLSVDRNPISTGDPVLLTANNTAVINGSGTITSVEFYRESNGIAGLQVDTDTDLGAGNPSGSGSTSYTFATNGGAPDTYTYYALATDSNANTSAPVSTTLTVSSKPSFNFGSATYFASEADGTATITVNLSAPAAAATTIDYTTSDGTHFGDPNNPNVDGAAVAGRDYTTSAGTLHFAAGDTSKTFTVPLLNVKTFEGTRNLNLILSNPGSAAILGAGSTATLAITDNPVTAANGVDLPTSTPSSSYELTLTSAAQLNGFMALSPSATDGFGSGANVGPDMPFLEFSAGSTLFPATYAVSTVDSIKLSLFNTATTGTFGGHPGSFDVYLLSSDPDAALAAPLYRYTTDGATGIDAIGTQGAPLLVGSATFTNNTVGFNDFIFDNLSPDVQAALKASLNRKSPVRFVITPSAGSGASADWEGNSTFNNGAQKPQLTLLAEKSAASVENFSLHASSLVVNKNGTATITVDRTGDDLSDTATIAYATADGSAIAGTDYTTTSGVLNFAANDAQASFTIPIADTAISPDKYFTLTISTPTVSGAGHLSSIAPPTTEIVTIHDIRTTNITSQAGDVATVQPAGPRAAPNGKNFFNIEGAGAAANASFGVADFNTAGLSFTLPEGQTIGTINSISLGTINAPASFTHSGALDVYLVDDSTTDINNGTSPLIFDTTDPVEGLNNQLGAKHLLGTLNFDAAQPTGSFTDITLANGDPATLALLASDINAAAKFRIVITPEDSTVAATWAGTSFGTVDGTGNTYQAPRLSINFTQGVADIQPPTVTDSSFQFSAHPPTFTVTFSEDVSASLDSSPITVTNLASGTPVSFTTSYAAGTNIETLSFGSELPDGNYRVQVPSTVTDAAGNPLGQTFTSDFFVLKGDVNRDRSVSFADLVAVAQHYGQSGQSYATGDLDGDGKVAFSDLVAVAQNYGKSIAPPAQAAPVPLALPILPPLPAPAAAKSTLVVAPVSAKPTAVAKPLAKPLQTKPQPVKASPVVSTFSSTRISTVFRKKNDVLL